MLGLRGHVGLLALVVAATVAALLVVGAAAASVPQSVSVAAAKKKPAAKKTVRVRVPDAGNITVARFVITVKKSKKAKRSNAVRQPGSLSAKKLPKPKLRITNGKKLPKGLLVIGAVKRTKANRFIANVIAVNVAKRRTASTRSTSSSSQFSVKPDIKMTVFTPPPQASGNFSAKSH